MHSTAQFKYPILSTTNNINSFDFFFLARKQKSMQFNILSSQMEKNPMKNNTRIHCSMYIDQAWKRDIYIFMGQGKELFIFLIAIFFHIFFFLFLFVLKVMLLLSLKKGLHIGKNESFIQYAYAHVYKILFINNLFSIWQLPWAIHVHSYNTLVKKLN